MKQFPNLNVLTFETDDGKNTALDGLLARAGVNRTGRLVEVSAFRTEVEAARQAGRGLLWASNVIIVGNIIKYGEDDIPRSDIGNHALVTMVDLHVAYPLSYVSEAFGKADNPYPDPVPAVSLGYGNISTSSPYARATAAYGVHPYGALAVEHMELALTEASRVLRVDQPIDA